MILSIIIPGPAIPWQRAPLNRAGKRTTCVEQQAYQRHVKACASASLLGISWDRTFRYGVDIIYTPQDRRRRDIDNVAKTLLDACNGVLWDDDSQVDYISVFRHLPSKSPMVSMAVNALP